MTEVGSDTEDGSVRPKARRLERYSIYSISGENRGELSWAPNLLPVRITHDEGNGSTINLRRATRREGA